MIRINQGLIARDLSVNRHLDVACSALSPLMTIDHSALSEKATIRVRHATRGLGL